MATDIRERIAAQYLSFSCVEQKAALLRIAKWLTLVGRDAYNDPREDISRLRAVNEAQHQVLGQLEKLELSSLERYEDDVFVQILVAQFEAVGIGDERALSLITGKE
jgi:hypothetical protein